MGLCSCKSSLREVVARCYNTYVMRIEKLKGRLKGDVYTEHDVRAKYAHDASLFEMTPTLVVAPKDSQDLKELISFAREEDVTLTARSGGTGMDGGALSSSIVVDFTKYFNHVHEVTDSHAVTEPGVYYRDFEPETLARNRLMPSYPASREICTVGGMVANNSGGEKTLRYGKTEDYVRALRVVLADGNEYEIAPVNREEREALMARDDFLGEVYRKTFTLLEENYKTIQQARPKVTKNSAGYYLWNVWDRERDVFDLTQLFVGSQGTLGLITEITFDLVTPDPHSQMMVAFLDDMTRLGEVVETVLAHKPATFESYDDKTLGLALRFFPEFLKRLGLRNIFVLLYNGLPELFSIIRHGLPKLVLQITFEGDDRDALTERAEILARELRRYNPRYIEVISDPREADEYWLIRRESFNLLRHKVKGKKTAPFIDDIVVPTAVLSEFLPKLRALLDAYGEYMIDNIAGHIGNGNFHIIPLMDLSDEKARAIIPELATKVYALVAEYGGSTTGEHNDGIIRTPFLEKMYGKEVTDLFQEVKTIFDPEDIFNPGKKVGGTLDDVVAYMKTKNV